MEDKLDKLLLLIEQQNKAWSIHLDMMQGLINIIDAKVNSQDNLLKEHPTVREESNSQPTQPFNAYGDAKPYGVDIEEEKQATPQSFPAAPPATNPKPEPIASGERVISLDTPKQEQPVAPPQSKAEMLERQVNLPEQSAGSSVNNP